MATYAVGDIQGCLPPLKKLLKRVDFNIDRDQLLSVGDVVNRGPACLDTLRYLHKRRDNVRMVLGNHDLHLLAAAAGAKKLSSSDTLAPILKAKDSDKLLAWLRKQPLLRRNDNTTLVHAGIPPQWSTAEAELRAKEVGKVLKGPDGDSFLAAMYGNEPNCWSDDLSGTARLRLITNYFTRMRFCTAEGRLDLASKGPPEAPGGAASEDPALKPWFSHPGKLAPNERIIFGHWAALNGRTLDPRLVGLDTGCVWGGAMTFYCLETGERISQACKPCGR